MIGDGRSAFLPFLSFDLHRNRGISFGLFSTESGDGLAMLVLVQFASILVIGWLLIRAATTIERTGFALIAGGAMGNLVDRAAHGAVTDFLRLHPLGFELFTFNFADVLISAGVGLVLLDAFYTATRKTASGEDPATWRADGP